jgi:spermidine synthase
MRAAVLAFFFLSGATGLLYEVAWIRMAGTILGNTTQAVGTVVGVFMGGLALGAWLGGRAADRRGGGALLALYGRLEAGVAGTALAVPLLLAAAEPLFRVLWSALEGAPLAYGVLRALLVALVLILPTTLMGATFPVLARFLSRSVESAAGEAGRAYAVNTFGGVLGTLAAGFVLVPDLGLRATILVAAACNLAIGIASLRLARRAAPAEAVEPDAPAARAPLALAVSALSGFASLVYEVAWTRSLVLSLGSTVHAFTVVLTAFILGLALGSALASLLLPRFRTPGPALAGIQAAVALAAIALLPYLGDLPLRVAPALESVRHSFGRVLLAEFAVAGLFVLGPSILLGAVFPFVCRLALEARGAVGRSVAAVYTANTLGCIAGSVAASFALVPLLGLSRSILAAATLNLALSAGLLFRRSRPAALLPAAGAVLAWLLVPAWNPKVLASGAYLYGTADVRSARREGRGLREYVEADTELLGQYWDSYGLVTVHRGRDGVLTMRVNGKADASTGPSDRANMHFVGQLPMLQHPAPRRAMLIGLGAGLTLQAMASHPVERVDCVDISGAVVRAAGHFREANGGVLDRPNVRLVVADGRNALRFGREPYDVIVSQPSNLWISGMANLFTRDFFEEASARLAPGGVFGQWLHAYALATDDFREVLRTFFDVFPHGSLWEIFPGSDYVLIGTREPARLSLAALEERLASTRALEEYLEPPRAASLLGHLVTDADGARAAAGPGRRITDDRCAIEYRAPRSLGRDSRPATLRWLDGVRDNRAEKALLTDEPGAALVRRERRRAIAEAVRLGAEEQPVLALKAMPRGAVDPRTRVFLDAVSDAALALALRRRRAGDSAEALETLSLIPSSSSRYPEARLELGDLLLEARDLEGARAAFEAARESDPQSFGARVGLAQIRERAQAWPEAAALWTEALSLRPDSVPARYQLAFCLWRQGKTDDARAELRKVLDRDPANARASRLLAEIGP